MYENRAYDETESHYEEIVIDQKAGTSDLDKPIPPDNKATDKHAGTMTRPGDNFRQMKAKGKQSRHCPRPNAYCWWILVVWNVLVVFPVIYLWVSQFQDPGGQYPNTLENVDKKMDAYFLARTCAEWLAKLGHLVPGSYDIDPDGSGGEQSFKVSCAAVAEGRAWTQVSHNRKSISLNGGSYSSDRYSTQITIRYAGPMSQLRALVMQSRSCRLHVSLRCLKILTGYTGWVDFYGAVHNIKDGADICAINNATGSRKCKCGLNKSIWTGDVGYITNTSQFPVTKMAFGDLNSQSERVRATLGPMECEGTPDI